METAKAKGDEGRAGEPDIISQLDRHVEQDSTNKIESPTTHESSDEVLHEVGTYRVFS